MYKILIVDDEEIERDGVSFLITEYDYPFKIYTANNGMDALEILKSNRMDLICSDIKMPFMNGIEFCTEAKKVYSDVRVLLLTAFNDFEYTKEAIKIKVDDYLMKPIIVEEFQEAMEKLLAELDCQQAELRQKKQMLNRYKDADVSAKQSMLNALVADIKLQMKDTDSGDEISDKKIIRMVIEMINKEYTTDISLSTLAERVYLSKGYLSVVFKKEMSMSVMQYITLLRMQKAQKLLTATNMKISDICTSVGYHDLSYFCLTFKRFYGMTAARFRNGEADEE